jgi:endoglucanase
MDEVGFMVTGHCESGSLRFRQIGGVDERILPGKKVLVGERKLPGVIGVKPVHFQESEDRGTVKKISNLYIDIGAARKDEAEKIAPTGEYISFDSEFIEYGKGCVKAKALDDRVGCIALIEALKHEYNFDLYACFTVQEEVGLRGSEVAAYIVKPDIALILEGTTCSDVPDVDKFDYSTELGCGPALTIMDRTCYPDRDLVDYIHRLALENSIPLQFKQTTTGGNDAGKIQRAGIGTKVASISVPCRYIHSPVSTMSFKDFENYILLLKTILKDFNESCGILNYLALGGVCDA